jgi:hypothetical protein
MEPDARLSLSDLLLSRRRSSKWLARELDTTEATVSRWRKAPVPSEANRRAIYAALQLTDEEIAALGWEKEPANV